MVIYNVTVKVEIAVVEEWIEWMKQKHIPHVLKTGCFNNHLFTKLIGQDETDGLTFAIQYHAENMAAYQKYQDNYAEALQKEAMDLYKDKFVAFRTIMETV